VEDDLRKTGVKCWRIKQWIGENEEKYVRQARLFKNCRDME
jgi:hypothetical protein